jgi:hypothetical protein
MKTFWVSIDYTDRRLGPRTARRGRINAGTPHLAVYRYLRAFWESADRKTRNDIRNSGLKIECRACANLQEAPAEVKAMLDNALKSRVLDALNGGGA